MTRKHFIAGLMVAALAAVPFARAEDAGKEDTMKVLRHVVLFRYKDDVTADQKAEVLTRFAALKDQIDVILTYQGGPNIEAEGLGDGFEHVFCVTFKDEAARAEYLPHPAHKKFVEFAGPLLDKATVADFWGEM
ncbi:MAG: Dabb family protein [Candidatus Hydrogenedens sp.]|nr:Dabb family protein [Candidatus Hydrogenedens sp.]